MKTTSTLSKWTWSLLAFQIGLWFGATVNAQVFTQTKELLSGWNSIWVEVEPTNNAIEAVFASQEVEEVWAYFAKTSTADFIRNANELPYNNPSWRRYFPTNSPKAILSTLFTVNAGRAYLVKVANNMTLTIPGRPSVRSISWTPDSFNLRGFSVDEIAQPTFDSFFAFVTAQAGQPIYRLDNNGLWQQVAGLASAGGNPVVIPGTALMKSGEAYWVFSRGESDFHAPLSLRLDIGDGLDYAGTLDEQNLHLRTLSGIATVTITDLSGGALPLYHYVTDAPTGENWVNLPSPFSLGLLGNEENLRLAIKRTDFADVYETVLSITDGIGTRHLLPVSAGKAGNNPTQGNLSGGSGGGSIPECCTGLWVGNAVIDAVSDANVLKISQVTSGGNSTNVALAVLSFPGPNNDFQIAADQVGIAGNGLNVFLKSDGTVSNDNAQVLYEVRQTQVGTNTITNNFLTIEIDRGLTMAQTVIDAVNDHFGTNQFLVEYIASSANSEGASGIVAEVTPTSDARSGHGSQFNLRLILHVETDQTTRLLKQVIQLWQDGFYRTNPTNGLFEPDPTNPGHYVLLTDDARIMDFKGATLRDGEMFGRRISSAGFDFPDTAEEPPGTIRTGGSLAKGSTVSLEVILPYDFATNPFYHRQHPDHDNFDDTDPSFSTIKPEALEITRKIELQFFENPSPGEPSVVDYGYNVIDGSYHEILQGLHKRDLVVTGEFRLRRLSFIGQLNPTGGNQ